MKKVIASSFLGNALEFYDFTLYGAFAAIIGQTFFPSQDPFISLLNSLGIFAVGFLMRPFGAIVFGRVGDVLGRKLALQLSVLCMGIPTLIIGLTPSYESIGFVAPILIILSRLLQGLSTGGEYNGSAIFALEHAKGKGQGLVSGLITSSCGVGAMVGMGASIIVLFPTMPEWAWRVPFVVGSLGCFVTFYMRTKLQESPEFMPGEKISLLKVMGQNKKASILTFLLGSCDGILSYISFVFLEVFLESNGVVSPEQAHLLGFLSIFIFIISAPLAGIIFDKIGGRKTLIPLMYFILAGALPSFYWLQKPFVWPLIVISIYFGAVSGALTGCLHAFVQKLFPVHNRYTGISFTFSLGISFGGCAPYILTYLWIYTHSFWALGLYVMWWNFLCLWMMKKHQVAC